MSQQQLISCYAAQQAFHWFITGVLIPVLILIFQSRGLSLTEIGLVMALWIGTTSLLEIPLGSASDRFGRRRTYLLSLLLSILGTLVLLGASTFYFVLVSAVLLGAARAVYSGTLDAWFYDAFQLAQGRFSYHDALARINLMVTIGLATGALVGGGLPDLAQSHVGWFHSKYDLNLLLMVVAMALLFIVTLRLIPCDKITSAQLSTSSPSTLTSTCVEALRAAFSHAVLKRVMQTTLVFGMVLSSVENLWQPYLANIMAERSSSTAIFGLISALYFLMAAAASWWSVRLLRWFDGSHRMLLLFSRLTAGLVLLLLATATQIVSFTVAYLVFFFLFTLGENSQMVLTNASTQREFRSTMLSISSFVVTAGGVMSSLGLGWVADHYGIATSWYIAGAVLAGSSLLFTQVPIKSGSGSSISQDATPISKL